MKKSTELKTDSDVQVFLQKLAATSPPAITTHQMDARLLFAMDATASRAMLWQQACDIQSDMFQQTTQLGHLSIQLAYYRGYGEFYACPWATNANALLREMSRVTCSAGITQIERVLAHAFTEHNKRPIQAVVFIGDSVEEQTEHLYERAGALAIHGIPVFMFQEGYEAKTEQVFRRIAKMTRGAYCHFDAGSAVQLKALLLAVSQFVMKGRAALEHDQSTHPEIVQQLLQQLPDK
ncbi:MAG: VWA domain-containing protein [Gammaproteobacteria bacterium]|nr:VWA domain-containing protein [Gammaproteobacteria bacterium]